MQIIAQVVPSICEDFCNLVLNFALEVINKNKENKAAIELINKIEEIQLEETVIKKAKRLKKEEFLRES